MIETLNILEGFNLRDMQLNSAEYIHTLVEALKLAYADRDTYYGDPKFVKIPAERLLSKEYAAERRKLITRWLRSNSAPATSGRIRPSIPPTRRWRTSRSTMRCWRRTPPAWMRSIKTASCFRRRLRERGCPP